MRQYELLYVVPGTLSEQEVAPIAESVEDAIKKNGGTIVSSHDLGKSRLAYPIRHIRYGYYRTCYIEADSASAVAIQKKLSLMDQMLRVIVRVYNPKKDPKKTSPVLSDIALAALREEMRGERLDTRMPAEMQQAAVVPRPAAPVVEEVRTTEAVELKDIDKKLDEILENDLTNV